MNPLVSIIVPVYNVELYLKQCLDSIINQTYKNLEIILIDDGSTDNSGAICDEYASKDKRIRVIHKENGGVSSSRNVGIDNSTGVFISFVDSDDYLELNAIHTLLNNMNRCNAELVICNYYKVQQDLKIKNNSIENTLETREEFVLNCLVNLNTSHYYKIYNKLFKRNIIVENNLEFPKNISIGEDLRFNLLYFANCKSIISINEYLYNYRLDNDKSIMNTNKTIAVNDVVDELRVVIDFLNNQNADSDKINKGIDKYILDKANVYVLEIIRATIKKRIAYKLIKEFIVKIKEFHCIKNYNSTKWPLMAKCGWKHNSGFVLYWRHKLILIRYRIIMRIRHGKN